MDIKNCGRKFAVVTSRRHYDGGFEAVMPSGTLWAVDDGKNPDARRFLLEARKRNAEIAVIDEDGSAHPDILYKDLCDFKQDLRDSRSEMQIIVIADASRFQGGDPYLGQLVACGINDILSSTDPRRIDQALSDLVTSPMTAQDAAAKIGPQEKKGFFSRRKDRKMAKRGAKGAAEPVQAPPTITSNMEPGAAAAGQRPLTSAPSEASMARAALQNAAAQAQAAPQPGTFPQPAVTGATRPQAVQAAPVQRPVEAGATMVMPADAAEAVARGAQPVQPAPPAAPAAPASEAGGEARCQLDNGNGGAGDSRRQPDNGDAAPAAQAVVGITGAGKAAAAREAARHAAPAAEDLLSPRDRALAERIREEMAAEYDRRERDLKAFYEGKLALALRNGREQRKVAVASLVDGAMTAEASIEAVSFAKSRLKDARVCFVEHDEARFSDLEHYGAIRPGDEDIYPDVAVHDFGSDIDAAAACGADAVLLVLSPAPWDVAAQNAVWNGHAEAREAIDGKAFVCVPAKGPRMRAIAATVLGEDVDALAIPDPNHFAMKPVVPPEGFEEAMGQMLAQLASEMAPSLPAARRDAPKPARERLACFYNARTGEATGIEELPASGADERLAELAAAHPASDGWEELGLQESRDGSKAFRSREQIEQITRQKRAALAAKRQKAARDGGGAKGAAAEPAPAIPAEAGVAWVDVATGEVDGPYRPAEMGAEWLSAKRAERAADNWREVGTFVSKGSHKLHWKAMANVENEAAQLSASAKARIAAEGAA